MTQSRENSNHTHGGLVRSMLLTIGVLLASQLSFTGGSAEGWQHSLKCSLFAYLYLRTYLDASAQY
jgi:hypothetical protein